MIRRVLLACLFTAVPATVTADPLPVHTPTRHVGGRPSREQRLQVADAIAVVLGQSVPEVLSGQETAARLQSLNPSALECDLPQCAGTITGPLHARSIALVRQEYVPTGSFRVVIDVVNPHGEVTAHAEGEEPVGAWVEAVALGRVVAGRVGTILRAPAPEAIVRPAPVVPRPVEVLSTLPLQPVVPPAPVTVMRRRPWELGLGGGLVVAGIVATVIGAAAIGQDGSEVSGQAFNPAMHTVYTAGAGHYVLLGVGIPAILGGAVLVIDGLRGHREDVPAGSLTRLHPGVHLGVSPWDHGGALTASGTF